MRHIIVSSCYLLARQKATFNHGLLGVTPEADAPSGSKRGVRLRAAGVTTICRPGLFTLRLPYRTRVQAWLAGGLTFLSAVLLSAGSIAALRASIAGLRALRIPRQMQVHLAAGGVFVGTWLIRFLALTGFPNDHFFHLAPAQQMLAGELPSRDFVDPGQPLMYLVSFLARLAVDSPLLAEAIVVSTAFGLAAVLTLYAAFSVSGSLSIAVVVTVAEIALFPRTYHYPKLLLLAAGV